MKRAFIFPGQGAQFPGMGKELFESNQNARALFNSTNEILGFNITDIMFEGSEDDLVQTSITQPAIFLHSVILASTIENFRPDMVAGHSVGELSALVANKTLTFEDGLKLVHKRGLAMQRACELNPSTMAAILGLEDAIVEKVCAEIEEVVVAANYNRPEQLVISGSIEGVNKACALLLEKGAKRALILPVGGAFHSPLMEPAQIELSKAIETTTFHEPICPIYQNFTATAVSDSVSIRSNLNSQLTAPVKWTQTILQMVADGATHFTEVGPGKVLSGLVKKIHRDAEVDQA